MQRRVGVGALLLIGLGIILGATVFRTDAQATALAPAPTLVREQNLNAHGNIRVHEQGVVPVRGTVSAAVAPISAWSAYEGFNIGRGFSPVLAGPSPVINVTSVSAAASPGHLAYISLIAEYVPDSANDCAGASGGAIAYALDNVSAPIGVVFPTPLEIKAPSGSKACLFGSAGGTGAISGGHADLNASGFYGG